MKRLMPIVALLCLSVVNIAMSQSITVVTPSSHILHCNINNGEAEVTFHSYNYPNYGTSLDGDLIIPDSIEYNNVKYPVTTIGYQAFSYATMQTVSIPNTVKTIGQEAFSACMNLTHVVIPNSVTYIAQLAFAGCHNIVSVQLPDSITVIKYQTFDADTALVSVTIPDAVTSIETAAFSQCYSLRSVTFGHSVSSIGFGCFSHGKHLDSLIFLSDNAPYIDNLFFTDTLHLVIDIPCGSYHSYHAAFGVDSNYTYSIPSVDLSMEVSSTTPEWGSAIVVQDADSHDVRCDSSSVVQAVPNYGYHFTGWSNGSTKIIDTLFLDRDSSLIASFAKNRYTLTVRSNDESIGTVSGSNEYYYLDTAEISATATFHHHLVRWSDGSRDEVRNYVITRDTYLTAQFAIDTHRVTIASSDETQGLVYGNEVFSQGIGDFAYGTVATVMAVPNEGHHFVHWSNGSISNPYTFPVLEDIDLVAEFAVGNEGIDGVAGDNARIKVLRDEIVIEGNEGMPVRIFDTAGQLISKDKKTGPLPAGVYMVQIGDFPAHKVVVVR
ncbi:MAG: leucine-rich repeat protein [Bacteroidales bacterium]|nr:leucine-rich repeat protein [Bacteroidales bacterium]